MVCARRLLIALREAACRGAQQRALRLSTSIAAARHARSLLTRWRAASMRVADWRWCVAAGRARATHRALALWRARARARALDCALRQRVEYALPRWRLGHALQVWRARVGRGLLARVRARRVLHLNGGRGGAHADAGGDALARRVMTLRCWMRWARRTPSLLDARAAAAAGHFVLVPAAPAEVASAGASVACEGAWRSRQPIT